MLLRICENKQKFIFLYTNETERILRIFNEFGNRNVENNLLSNSPNFKL